MAQKNYKSLVASLVILAGGAFAFGLVVTADDATTSVIVANAAPTVSVNFNGGSAITLTEGTFTWATASLTITDTNGCATIRHVSSAIFLASTSAPAATTCADNDNSCYQAGSSTSNTLNCMSSSTNACTGGVDTSYIVDCGFKLWYIAEGTDAAAPDWATSIWAAVATASDWAAGGTTTASNTGQTTEINSLAAMEVTATLSYGSVSAGANTGALNSTTTGTTTGNIAIDANVKGDADGFMDSGPNTLAIGYQEWALNPFTHGTGGTDLTTSDTRIEYATGNPTSTTSPLGTSTPWGIEIPGGQANGTYTGTNTFTAVAD